MRFRLLYLSVAVCVLLISPTAIAQSNDPQQTPAPSPVQAQPQSQPSQGQFAAASSAPLTKLLIGAGDEGDIAVYGVPDLSQHVRVNSDGDISLPLVGKITVAGLSADEAQALIERRLVDGGFLKNPHVTFIIKDYTSQGVTILGEVARPGTYSPLGARRLYDAFMAAGGLTARAGNSVAISHRDSSAKPQTVTLSDDPAISAANNLELQPGDTVVVARAGIVYVVGEVLRPGGFVIENNSGITLVQVWAMASGPTRMANLSHAMIVRKTASGKIENTEVDIKKILQAKAPDITLLPDDILFVPASKGKMAMDKGAGSVFSMLTSLAIYRF